MTATFGRGIEEGEGAVADPTGGEEDGATTCRVGAEVVPLKLTRVVEVPVSVIWETISVDLERNDGAAWVGAASACGRGIETS